MTWISSTLLGARRRDDAGLLRLLLGVAALVVFFVVVLAVVVSLTFSVAVDGHSMEPTLHQGDRLEVNLFHRHDIHRFDVVEAAEPSASGAAGGAPIVKRVIGLPGDRIEIEGGAHPVVYLRPAGSTTTYRVDNVTWAGQVGASQSPCCTKTGTSLSSGDAKKWVTVPAGDYWLIGDNWGGSTDSRVFGFVTASGIKATLNLRILPWSRKGHLPHPATLVPVGGR